MQAQGQGADRLAELRVSARGWHGVQLAVLGFIGLCGVLQPDASDGNPGWLRWLVGLLVLAAFALACAATVLVALAAWPIYGPQPAQEGSAKEIARTSRRLRSGIAVTFVAVALLALATSSVWWPVDGGPDCEVEVRTSAGVVCGELQN